MAQYKETNRFHCESSSGAHYVVIEQILTSRLALDVGESPRTDYVTDTGEIAERLDDDTFLLLLSAEVLHVA
ncbi:MULTISPECIES: hypothetical protein [Rhizobium]|uniref:Uncharacterized protein n=1 Tax=Rhizobium metallidurans TaxID=1265931 RepID=A0A7W6CNP0_9HYPH|nr:MULTISPECIES: hypothetical protein [Rhizobium]MBB3962463.1 hypothetical protein [Rhizobium metallidurans]